MNANGKDSGSETELLQVELPKGYKNRLKSNANRKNSTMKAEVIIALDAYFSENENATATRINELQEQLGEKRESIREEKQELDEIKEELQSLKQTKSEEEQLVDAYQDAVAETAEKHRTGLKITEDNPVLEDVSNEFAVPIEQVVTDVQHYVDENDIEPERTRSSRGGRF